MKKLLFSTITFFLLTVFTVADNTTVNSHSDKQIKATVTPPASWIPIGNEKKEIIDSQTKKKVIHLTSGKFIDTIFHFHNESFGKINGRDYLFFASSRPRPEKAGKTIPGERQILAADVETGDLYYLTTIPNQLPGDTSHFDFRPYYCSFNKLLKTIFFFNKKRNKLFAYNCLTGEKKLLLTLPVGARARQFDDFADSNSIRIIFSYTIKTKNGQKGYITVADFDTNFHLINNKIVVTCPEDEALNHVEINPKNKNVFFYKLHTGKTGLSKERPKDYYDHAWLCIKDLSKKDEKVLVVNSDDSYIDHMIWGASGKYIYWDDNAGHMWKYDYQKNKKEIIGNVNPIHNQISPDEKLWVYDTRKGKPYLSCKVDNRTLENWHGAIWIYDIDNKNTEKYANIIWATPHPRHPHPRFSPDGSLISFVAGSDITNTYVAIMKVEKNDNITFLQIPELFKTNCCPGPFQKDFAFSSDKEISEIIKLRNKINGKGSLSFWIKPDQFYSGGINKKVYNQNLIEAPDLFKIRFSSRKNFVLIEFKWLDKAVSKNTMYISLPRLPSNKWINLFFVWDCENGVFNCYINGTPYRDPKAKMPGWKVGSADALKIYSGKIPVSKISVNQIIPDKKFVSNYVGKYKGTMDKYIGAKKLGTLDIEKSKGKLIYSNPLNNKSCLKNWVIEGPAEYKFTNGWLDIWSKQPDGDPRTGHIVFWCPEDFSDNFIAEWEVQIISKYGLCIVFFDALGTNGKSIFDKSIAKRTGIFKEYVNGDINCYHISYYAATPLGVRSMANLRKNKGFYLLANGPVGIEYGSKSVHKITLVKNGGHIQLASDGKIIIDFTDDGKTYGPIWTHGNIGLRQMKWTRAKYRNFKVYLLK